jgi:hypothetical protein
VTLFSKIQEVEALLMDDLPAGNQAIEVYDAVDDAFA